MIGVNIMDFNNPKKKKEEKTSEKKAKKEKEPVLSDDELYELFSNEDLTHIVELPFFPEDFFHYDGGKHISDEEINQWIEECVLFLEQEQEEFICTANSGDSKVMVMRVFDEEDDYRYIIEVYRDRYTIEIKPEEL
jgi:hypothetical protein